MRIIAAAVLLMALTGAAAAATRTAPPLLKEGQIYLARADGTHLRVLRTGGTSSDPVWSRDGTSLAFVLQHEAGEPFFPYVVQRDGRHLRGLVDETDGIDGSSSWPSWAPSGRRIAYQSNGWKYDAQRPAFVDTVATTGRAATKLVDPAARPAWSPDGRTIVYVDRDGSLQSVGATSGAARRLASPPSPTASFGACDFARSGAALACTVVGTGTDPLGLPVVTSSSCVVLARDGSGLRALPHSLRDYSPSWSADGRRIVVVRETAPNVGRVVVLRASDGKVLRTLRLRLAGSIWAARVGWSSRNELAISY